MLGNKIDEAAASGSRAVSEKRARQWCAAKGDLPHFDTSAKDGDNVAAAFEAVARAALRNEVEEEP